jgi:hypothetical protein
MLMTLRAVRKHAPVKSSRPSSWTQAGKNITAAAMLLCNLPEPVNPQQ